LLKLFVFGIDAGGDRFLSSNRQYHANRQPASLCAWMKKKITPSHFPRAIKQKNN
jgi:hypothetical protein